MEVSPEKPSVRVWMDFDITEVRRHLLLIDDLYGTCANCKQIGLNYIKNASCPKCKTQFKYLATKQKKVSEINKILKRVKAEKLSLTLIDRDDFEHSSAKAKLQDIFQ